MLLDLIITHIALIQHAEVEFGKGFNVISGETGAGKSAIMKALSLVLGERADNTVLRKGCAKGTVEARFDLKNTPSLRKYLAQKGIDAEEDLILKREISSQGRSRAFVNNQMAQVSLLKEIGSFLVEIVGQHAKDELRSGSAHRQLLDLFGDCENALFDFRTSWKKLTSLQSELKELVENETQRERDLEVVSMQLEELTEANLVEGEEEELFQEYSLLSQSDNLKQEISTLVEGLSDEQTAAIPHLRVLQNSLKQAAEIDSSLEDTLKAFTSALVELEEVSYTLTNRLSKIEEDPERQAILDERLKLINQMKKKYGPTIQEAIRYKDELESRLDGLENADTRIEEIRSELAIEESRCDQLAKKLTEERITAGKKLEKVMSKELKALNMPKAEFFVDIHSQVRSEGGDESVQFCFAPNVGERKIPIESCASGGELSRILLAIKSLLAEKSRVATLIFDEVDANIGGETASVVGTKLAEIGKKQQIFCITHFPQVAKLADHHLQIHKEETEGRTHTRVRILNNKEKKNELNRMLGFSHQS